MNPITVTSDTATQTLERIHDAIAPGKRRGLMLTLGRTARNEYRRWFRMREMDSPNKQGWPRQHFWSRISKATEMDESQTNDGQSVVGIADRAINAKIHGGTWGPRPGKKLLAIPLRPEAYGIRPSAGLIDGIFFIKSRTNAGILAKKENGMLVAYWRLVPRVTVTPDARALPPRDNVAAALVQKAEQFLMRASTKLAPTTET